jgi:hypothetical protein
MRGFAPPWDSVNDEKGGLGAAVHVVESPGDQQPIYLEETVKHEDEVEAAHARLVAKASSGRHCPTTRSSSPTTRPAPRHGTPTRSPTGSQPSPSRPA